MFRKLPAAERRPRVMQSWWEEDVLSNDQSTSTTPQWHLTAVGLQRAEPGGCSIMSHPSRFWLFSLGCQGASGSMCWQGQAGDQWPACQGLPGMAVARGQDGCLQPPADLVGRRRATARALLTSTRQAEQPEALDLRHNTKGVRRSCVGGWGWQVIQLTIYWAQTLVQELC